jgi:ribosome-associated protein
MDSKELAVRIAHALDSKKGVDIRVLKIQDLTVISDYFVIAGGNSTTMVAALADEVEYQLGLEGVKPLHVEGQDTRNWILLDYGSVIVHVFDPGARSYYNLERLWADAEPVEVELEEN